MAKKINVENLTGFATTLDGKPNNTRIRNQALHGVEKQSIYPDSWNYIDRLLGKAEGQEGAITNVIKLSPSTIDLVKSMAEEGQIHPIYINAEKELVDGFGRVEAVAFAIGVTAIGPEKLQACLEMAKTAHKEEDDADWADTVHTYCSGIEPTLICEVTDKDANEFSMEANIRRQNVNALDLGFYFKQLQDNGETAAEIASRVYPSMPLHVSEDLVLKHIEITKVSPSVQRSLRNGTCSVESALNSLIPAEEKAKSRQAKWAVGAKSMHNALTNAEKGDLTALKKIFGDAIVEETENLVKIMRTLCFVPQPKPKAEKKKPKKKAELDSENKKLRSKLAQLSMKTGVSIDELMEEHEEATAGATS